MLGIIDASHDSPEAQRDAEIAHAEATRLGITRAHRADDGTIRTTIAAEPTGTTPPARSARAKLGMRGIISLLLSIVKAR